MENHYHISEIRMRESMLFHEYSNKTIIYQDLQQLSYLTISILISKTSTARPLSEASFCRVLQLGILIIKVEH
jgi:hypothetical protein